MAFKTVDLNKCPSCNAQMFMSGDGSKYICPYCGAVAANPNVQEIKIDHTITKRNEAELERLRLQRQIYEDRKNYDPMKDIVKALKIIGSGFGCMIIFLLILLLILHWVIL
jgi:uncharacterized Zn finger protein (UPF0148 family)